MSDTCFCTEKCIKTVQVKTSVVYYLFFSPENIHMDSSLTTSSELVLPSPTKVRMRKSRHRRGSKGSLSSIFSSPAKSRFYLIFDYCTYCHYTHPHIRNTRRLNYCELNLGYTYDNRIRARHLIYIHERQSPDQDIWTLRETHLWDPIVVTAVVLYHLHKFLCFKKLTCILHNSKGDKPLKF
jgi:hypothetical protein